MDSKERKKNNIVMKGLTLNSNDSLYLKEVTENIVKKHLNIDVNIKSARKIGSKTCRVELQNTKDKMNIIKNKSKLKNSGSGQNLH